METPIPFEQLDACDVTIVRACAMFTLQCYAEGERQPGIELCAAVLKRYGVQALFYMAAVAIKTLDGELDGPVELHTVDVDGNPLDIETLPPDHRAAYRMVACVLAGDYPMAFQHFVAPARAGQAVEVAVVFDHVLHIAGARLKTMGDASTRVRDAGYLITTQPGEFQRRIAEERQSTVDREG